MSQRDRLLKTAVGVTFVAVLTIAGCLWLDRDTEVVPRNPDLAIARLDVRDKPAFWFRFFYGNFFGMKPGKDMWGGDMVVKEGLFRARNKGNAEDSPACTCRSNGRRFWRDSSRAGHNWKRERPPKASRSLSTGKRFSIVTRL